MDKKLNDSGMDGSGQYGQNRYQSKRKKIASQKNEVIRSIINQNKEVLRSNKN